MTRQEEQGDLNPEFVEVRKASQLVELEATDNAVGAKGADAVD